MIRIDQWLPTFKVLHQKARAGLLSGDDLQRYWQLRDEMTQLMVTERVRRAPGRAPRKMVRVALAIQVELDLVEGRQRLLTSSLSAGGFGGFLPSDPGPANLAFALKLSGSPLVGRVKVVNIQRRSGSLLVSFAFVDLTPADRERLEITIFDAIIRELDAR